MSISDVLGKIKKKKRLKCYCFYLDADDLERFKNILNQDGISEKPLKLSQGVRLLIKAAVRGEISLKDL